MTSNAPNGFSPRAYAVALVTIAIAALVRVSLTPRGRREYDAKRARFVKAWGRELSDLDADALRGATVVLERLAQFFDGL